jgi:hypothetical protein
VGSLPFYFSKRCRVRARDNKMSKPETEGKITRKDRMMDRLLKLAPWLSFFLVSLPFPLLFFLLYLMSSASADAAVYMLLTLSSLAIGSVVGVLVAVLLFLYRRRWQKRLRDRMALDGVTAEEIPWFMQELTPTERKALKAIEQQDPLLADAYRETLAARLTATRVVASSTRNLLLVERRLNRASYLQGADTTGLQQELRHDRSRLAEIKDEGARRRAEAEARLQMIEAAASRGASWAETNFALQRLEAAQDHIPLALESARLEQQAREDVERTLGEKDPQASR